MQGKAQRPQPPRFTTGMRMMVPASSVTGFQMEGILRVACAHPTTYPEESNHSDGVIPHGKTPNLIQLTMVKPRELGTIHKSRAQPGKGSDQVLVYDTKCYTRKVGCCWLHSRSLRESGCSCVAQCFPHIVQTNMMLQPLGR